MQVNDILAQKKQLRKEHLALRAGLSATQKAALDAALCREIAAHPAFLCCDVLLCFFPVRDEPDLTAFYQLARKRGVKTAFPRCTGSKMTFHVVADEQELVEGRFGIRAPREDAPLADLTAHTLCLVPALAATKAGVRLGYGGGFYDRFLPDFPGTTLLPIYSMLIRDTLPCEPTDQRIRYILTEKGDLAQDG